MVCWASRRVKAHPVARFRSPSVGRGMQGCGYGQQSRTCVMHEIESGTARHRCLQQGLCDFKSGTVGKKTSKELYKTGHEVKIVLLDAHQDIVAPLDYLGQRVPNVVLEDVHGGIHDVCNRHDPPYLPRTKSYIHTGTPKLKVEASSVYGVVHTAACMRLQASQEASQASSPMHNSSPHIHRLRRFSRLRPRLDIHGH